VHAASATVNGGCAPSRAIEDGLVSQTIEVVSKPMDAHPILGTLHPDEEIHVEAAAGDSVVVVTNRRLAIKSTERLALDVPIDNLRRVQFDIERERPATLVVVPQQPTDEPQVLSVQPDEYEGVAQALVVLGQRLAAL
jgi:hypothetical protein